MNVRKRDMMRSGTPLAIERLEGRVLLSGTTYYVDPGGNDSGGGGASQPFATLQHASDMAQAGDTVIVRAGTYAGFVRGWNEPQSGTASAPVTFVAMRGAIINSRNNNTPDGIDIEPGCNYIIIRGFTIRNDGSITDAGIRYTQSTGGQILYNNIMGMGNFGITTSHADHVLIQGNVCAYSSNQHGIYVANACVDPIIIGNTVFGNAILGIHLNGDATEGGNGLIIGAVIEDNLVFNNGANGIDGDGVINSVYCNNVIYNNMGNGISLFQGDGALGPAGDVIVNNTIVVPAGARWDIAIQNAAGRNAVDNNILLNADPNNGAVNLDSASVRNVSSDYNIVSGNFSGTYGDSVLPLAQWQRQTGMERHSKIASAAQLFVNAAGNDFHLNRRSPAIDAGARANSPRSDFEGRPRPQGRAIDVGAYEYPQRAIRTPRGR